MPALDLSTWASGEVTWQEIHTLLHDRLKLPDLKLPGVTDRDEFPLLPHKDAKVDVRLEFFFSGGSDLGFQLEDGSGKVGFCIEVDINLGEDRSLFGVMTLGRKGCFRFSTCFESMGSLNEVLSGKSGFSGTATIEVFTCIKLDLLKLLPQNENLLTIDVGDAEGWIPVRFFAAFEAEKTNVDRASSVRGKQANLNVSLELEMEIGQKTVDDTALSIGVQFPGLVQAEPPLQMGVTYIKSHFGLEVENTENAKTETQVEFSLETHGYFHFRFPELKPEMKPILAHLEELPVFIEGAQGNLLDLSIPIVAELAINIENTDSIAITLRIQEPSIEIDVFSMLAKLAIGLPEPESKSGNKAIPLNTDIGFNFKGIALCLGRQGATTNADQFALEMVLGAKFGELAIDSFFRISDRELKIGLKRMEIPITMPLFPLSTNDFEESYIDRQDNSRKAGAYHIIDSINIPIDPAKPVGIQKAQAAILATTALIQAEIDTLSGSDVGARRDRLYAKLALMTQIFTLRGSLKNWNDSTFKLWLKTFVGAIERLTSPLQSNGEGFSLVYTNEGQQHTLFRNLSLVLEDLILQIPFRDPRNLGIQGTAHFSGFEEPFDALNKIRLSAGISATMIYFQFDAAGATIPFPDLGTPYKGGSLTIGEFRFGLGYTTRTFAFALAGELVLPEPLVDDLDTSDLIGVGVRLPVQSALNFKLDLMPIPLPKVVVIVPLIEFNIDLRKDFSPGIAETNVCTPYWDGLQLIVRDIYHVSFKQLAYSLFCGPLPVENIRYDADFLIGNASNGFTLVIDEFHAYAFLAGKFPIPFIFYPDHPFCDNFCVNLRLAGFSLNFDLQRPWPQFSPFALFELFALLCDPQYKVNPNGELANTLRATLRDAYIILPPNVRRLFPKIADRISKSLEITINLATYIQIAQLVMQFITPVMENLFDTAIATATPALRELQEELKQLDKLTPTNLEIASLNYRILLEVAKISRQILANTRVASASSVAEFKQKFVAEIERLKTGSNAIAPPEPLTRELLLEAVQSVSSKIWEGDLLVNITDIQEFRRCFAATITQLEEPFDRKLLTGTAEAFGSVLRNAYQGVSELTREAQRTALKQKLEKLLLTAISSQTGQIEQIIQQEVKKSVGQVLNALPPEFRKVRLEASFGGFEAQATLLLITLEEAVKEFKRRGQTRQRQQPQSFAPQEQSKQNNTQSTSSITALVKALPNPPKGRNSKRLYDPEDPRNNLFAGRELSGFKPDVLDAIAAIIPAGAKANSVTIAAYANVFDFQYYQFLGYLAEDGSFGMVTATQLSPLKLKVAGINVQLPLTIKGRLKLSGKAQRRGVTGEISAEIQAVWMLAGAELRIVGYRTPILTKSAVLNPGNIQLTSERPIEVIAERPLKPATLTLTSNGKFHVHGGLVINNFFGVNIKGTIDISETHAAVTNAEISYLLQQFKKEVLSFGLQQGNGHIGPGQIIELEGRGNLKLLTQNLGDVQGVVSACSEELQASLTADTLKEFKAYPFSFMTLTLENMKMLLKLQKKNAIPTPEFAFSGQANLKLWDKCSIAGIWNIEFKNNKLSNYVEGQLDWAEQTWANARVEINDERFTISGKTSFTLSQTDIPNLSVVGLVLRIDLDGSLTFDRNGSFLTCNLNGDWLLGIQPAGDKEHIIPLAIHKFSTPNQSPLPLKLFEINDFILPSISNASLDIPIPTIEFLGSLEKLKLHLPKPSLEFEDKPYYLVNDLPENLIKIVAYLQERSKWTGKKLLSNVYFDEQKFLNLNDILPSLSELSKLRWGNSNEFPRKAQIVTGEKGQIQLQLGDKNNNLRFPLPLQRIEGFALYLIWDSEKKQISISSQKPDEDGHDYIPPFDKDDLRIEWHGDRIVIRNNSDRVIDMSDWAIKHSAGHTFRIPKDFTLAASAEVAIWTKLGQNDRNNLYWGANQGVWNNAGGVLILKDMNDAEVTRLSYTPGSQRIT